MTLQLYILRSLLHSFVFALTGISMVVLPTILIQAVHKLGGVSMYSVFQYLPLVVVELVPYLLPMAFLLSVVSTFGRLAADRELTAIRMAGIHPASLCVSSLILAAGLAFLTHHLMSEVAPAYKYRARNFLRTAKTEAFKNMPPHQTHLSFGDMSMDWIGRDENGVLQGVSIRRGVEGGELQTYTARTATIKIELNEAGQEVFVVDFEDCELLHGNMWMKFETPAFRSLLSELFPADLKNQNRAKYRSSSDLQKWLGQESYSRQEKDEFTFEINRRRALSITCLIFVLLGIPTGIGLRSGTQLAAFTGAMGYGFVYYIGALQLGKGLFHSGLVGAMPAAWVTAGLFSIAGLVLSYRILWR